MKLSLWILSAFAVVKAADAYNQGRSLTEGEMDFDAELLFKSEECKVFMDAVKGTLEEVLVMNDWAILSYVCNPIER